MAIYSGISHILWVSWDADVWCILIYSHYYSHDSYVSDVSCVSEKFGCSLKSRDLPANVPDLKGLWQGMWSPRSKPMGQMMSIVDANGPMYLCHTRLSPSQTLGASCFKQHTVTYHINPYKTLSIDEFCKLDDPDATEIRLSKILHFPPNALFVQSRSKTSGFGAFTWSRTRKPYNAQAKHLPRTNCFQSGFLIGTDIYIYTHIYIHTYIYIYIYIHMFIVSIYSIVFW